MRDQRQHRRYPVRWPVAIIFNHSQGEEIFHGHTHDLSISGASILTEHNVFTVDPVTLLISIPPLHPALKRTLIEAKARMMYNVLSPKHQCFRIGLSFKSFKNDGSYMLAQSFEQRFLNDSGAQTLIR